MTEEITATLSRISSLFVIARTSAFTYKSKGVKVQDISRELGVRYVLEGSVRKTDGRLRIIAQLIDATTGAHLWAESYDRELKDIFAVQDEVRQKIVFALKVKLTPEEQARFRRFPTDNLEAYDFFLRGDEYAYRFTKEAIARNDRCMRGRWRWTRSMRQRMRRWDGLTFSSGAFIGITSLRPWSGRLSWRRRR